MAGAFKQNTTSVIDYQFFKDETSHVIHSVPVAKAAASKAVFSSTGSIHCSLWQWYQQAGRYNN